MTAIFRSGVRYRMPAVFGPAPGPRQKADGTPWKPEETGTMRCRWLTVTYLTARSGIEALLPPGFALRGTPTVSVSLAEFSNLYWLAGRGYGIAVVDVPATYIGRGERIEGMFCPVMWEGLPEAVLTGREELGFPKLFADIPKMTFSPERNLASGSVSGFGHTFLDIEVHDLTEVEGDRALPGSGGPAMYYKYIPRTSIGGKEGQDVAYVTTSLPPPDTVGDASPIHFGDFQFRKWSARGSVQWQRATFEQLPTTFHIVNALATLENLGYVRAELVEFSGPGIGISAGGIRAVQPV